MQMGRSAGLSKMLVVEDSLGRPTRSPSRPSAFDRSWHVPRATANRSAAAANTAGEQAMNSLRIRAACRMAAIPTSVVSYVTSLEVA